MSRMSNQHVRDAESRSLDNAVEVARLRARVERLEVENAELRSQLDDAPGRGRISHRGSNGQWYDTAEEAAGQYTWSEGGRENP
jgi:hypothetical protein